MSKRCILTLVLASVLVFDSNAQESGVAMTDALTRTKSSMIQLGKLLQIYSQRYSGTSPRWLGILAHADLDGIDPSSIIPLLTYEDPETRKSYDWVYFGGSAGERADSVILGMPAPYRRSKSAGIMARYVLYANGAVELLDEEVYQSVLKKQFLRDLREELGVGSVH